MSCFRRDVEDTVDAGLFQRCRHSPLGRRQSRPSAATVATEFAAAKADEYQLYLLLETGRLVDIVHGECPAAEEADVGKLVEVRHGDRLGLHSAHGEAGHGAMGLIGERAEVGIDVGDQFVDENRLEWSILKFLRPPIRMSLVMP